MGEFQIRENGEAGSYTILQGDRWIMAIQMNGEFTLEKQRAIVKQVCQSLNRVDFQFGVVKRYDIGDVVVWKGYNPAILRMQNAFSCDTKSPSISYNARVNDRYNSCHYSNLRPATADEVELLGDKDCYLL